MNRRRRNPKGQDGNPAFLTRTEFEEQMDALRSELRRALSILRGGMSLQPDANGDPYLLFDGVAQSSVEAELFRTGTSGQRLEMDDDGLRAYDPSGLKILELPSIGGERGLELTADTSDSIRENRKIRWLTSAGAAVAEVGAYRTDGVFSELLLRAITEAATDEPGQIALEVHDGDSATEYSREGLLRVFDDPALEGTAAARSFVEAAAGVSASVKLIDSSDRSSFVRGLDGLTEGGLNDGLTGWTMRYISKTLNIGSKGGHTGGVETITGLTDLAIGDLCFWLGCDAIADMAPFHCYTRPPVCSTAGQIDLQVFNTDSGARDPASGVHHFVMVHRNR